MAFRLPQLGALSNSPENTHPVLIFDRNESYDDYVLALKDFWQEVEQLKLSGLVIPGLGWVPLEFKTCCDMKALLLLTGMNCANAQYACFHCPTPLACRACCLPEFLAQCDTVHTPPFRITRDIDMMRFGFDHSCWAVCCWAH